MRNPPEIPKLERTPLRKANGDTVWHNVLPTRFATPLPPQSQPPIRAREVRREKNPNHIGVDPKGWPQVPSQVPPRRD